jgi:IPT/TIG domain
MSQSSLTVTPPNPSPPTNFSCTGATPPNPPNYTKTQYANPFNLSAVNSPVLVGDGRPVQAIPGVGVNPNPPPYFDDGTGATALAFAANTAALASGTGATSGGTEGTYPGTDTAPFDTPNCVGAVPASTSVAAEGAGTEVVVTQTYAAGVLVPGAAATYQPSGQTPAWAAGDPGGPLRTCSDLGSFTGVSNAAGTLNASPNATHASSLSPATNPTISATPATTLNPVTIASGTNTFALTVTGVGFTKQSVVYINNIPQTTVFVSSTTLTVAAALKKTSAGTLPVTVVTGGAVVTANSCNMTYT